PIIGGYWFQPSMTASAAFRRTSSGPGSSGKPWPRLTASCSRARRDITSNTESPRLAKTGFIAGRRMRSCLGRQAGLFPALDAAGEMLVVGKSGVLGDQRGRDRAIARAACEHDLLAGRIRQRGRIELRHRHVDRVRIALDLGLGRLAHVDQQHRAFGDAPGDLFGIEVVDAVAVLLRHRSSLQTDNHTERAETAAQSRAISPAGPNRNRRYTVTWVPTSTTRPVGIWK